MSKKTETNPTEELRSKIRVAIANALSHNAGKCLDNDEEFGRVQRDVTRAVEKELNITEPTNADFIEAAETMLAEHWSDDDFQVLTTTPNRTDTGAWVSVLLYVSKAEV